MRLVILESPYTGDVPTHVAYARACLHDCLSRGEAPVASHLLYTQPGVLDDDLLEQRQMTFEAGLAWRKVAQASVVYTDLGVSEGMREGIAAAERSGIPVEYRSLGWQPVPEAGAQAGSRKGGGSVTLFLSQEELAAVDVLAKRRELSRQAVLRQAFRLYQMADFGQVPAEHSFRHLPMRPLSDGRDAPSNG